MEPIDRTIKRMEASYQAVTRVNAEVAPKVTNPGSRARNRRAKAAGADENWMIRCVSSEGWSVQQELVLPG